jgi:hypothetical protein
MGSGSRRIARCVLAASLILGWTHKAHAAEVLDLDNDGMSDVWQSVHGIATGDTASDPDQDGHDNAQEARAGTNPHNIASKLQTITFTLNTTATTATLTWKSENEKKYDIEYSANLTTWTHHAYTDGNGSIKTSTITLAAAAQKFYRIRARQTEDDGDFDTLTDWEETLLGTSKASVDTDGDGMDDDKEFIAQLNPLVDDAFADPDSDGIPNLGEVLFGLNPDSATTTPGVPDTSVFPWSADSDNDGLTNQQELTVTLTHPKNDDTDYDGIGDGWEVENNLNPKLGTGVDGPTGDPDAEGLNNLEEFNNGTKARLSDTDGDGVNDKVEVDQGSNPNDPSDSQPPPKGTMPVMFTFGDGSSSHSEKYRFYLTPVEGDTGVRYRTNSGYGVVETRTMRLKRGAKYNLTMTHIGSSPKYRGKPKPDYDYTMTVGETDCVLVEDPYAEAPTSHGMLGSHANDDDPAHPDGSFWADGKTAYVSILDIETLTIATLPLNRQRRKLGVNEDVFLSLKPTMTSPITWTITGEGQINPITGHSTVLTAHERASTPTVMATVGGVSCAVSFVVVEPSGVTMVREPGTNVWHVNGIPSVGFKARPYISPFDVSFVNILIREGMCVGTGVGYYSFYNGRVHEDGAFAGVIPGDPVRPSKLAAPDLVQSGAVAGPPVEAGTFDWPIPWIFRVGNGAEKQFAIVPYHLESDASGKATGSKGGHSESSNLNDPTTDY